MTLANDLNPENCFDPFEAPSLAVSHAMLKGKSDFVLPRVRELPRMRELSYSACRERTYDEYSAGGEEQI